MHLNVSQDKAQQMDVINLWNCVNAFLMIVRNYMFFYGLTFTNCNILN